MVKRLECNITGRVQMVMFRDFAMRKSRCLGLVGTVRNIKDGSVEVIVEGEEEKLKQLLNFLNFLNINTEPTSIERSCAVM